MPSSDRVIFKPSSMSTEEFQTLLTNHGIEFVCGMGIMPDGQRSPIEILVDPREAVYAQLKYLYNRDLRTETILNLNERLRNAPRNMSELEITRMSYILAQDTVICITHYLQELEADFLKQLRQRFNLAKVHMEVMKAALADLAKLKEFKKDQHNEILRLHQVIKSSASEKRGFLFSFTDQKRLMACEIEDLKITLATEKAEMLSKIETLKSQLADEERKFEVADGLASLRESRHIGHIDTLLQENDKLNMELVNAKKELEKEKKAVEVVKGKGAEVLKFFREKTEEAVRKRQEQSAYLSELSEMAQKLVEDYKMAVVKLVTEEKMPDKTPDVEPTPAAANMTDTAHPLSTLRKLEECLLTLDVLAPCLTTYAETNVANTKFAQSMKEIALSEELLNEKDEFEALTKSNKNFVELNAKLQKQQTDDLRKRLARLGFIEKPTLPALAPPASYADVAHDKVAKKKSRRQTR